MNNVIITGPTGAIGMALIDRLVENDINVIAVVRSDSKRKNNLEKYGDNPLVNVICCDLNNLNELPDMVREITTESIDVFYHLGWDGTWGAERNNTYIQNLNVKCSLDAVTAAAKLGCKRFVGAGSQAEYGRVQGLIRKDTATKPETGYGMAKLCAGQMTRLLCNQLGMEHIWVRILSVYGPYDGENTLIMSVIDSLMKGQSPNCTKAEQQWDYIYSKDAAKALQLIGDRGIGGKVYCLGGGEAKPLKEYIEVVRGLAAPEINVNYGAIPYSEKQVMYLCADINDLRQDTGFDIEYTFEKGVKETLEWFREHK